MMTLIFKLFVSAWLLLATWVLFDTAFSTINQPSTLAVFMGVAMICLGAALALTGFAFIWRKRGAPKQ